MPSVLRSSLLSLLVLTLLTGLAYPLAVTGLAQVLFPRQANGSLLDQGGRIRGSVLIGQPFSDPAHFWSRPSATAPGPYNAGASTGSNLGPSNPALKETAAQRVAALKAMDPENHTPIPVDLVAASGSGLDPQISPAAAFWQAARVARARGLDEARVRELIRRRIEPRTWGILGEPRVNVLLLNQDLDREPSGHGSTAP
jgi:potassium-transporting ATPase KdpC subunit